MKEKGFLNKEQLFIYLGISLLYALGIIFFLVLVFGVDLVQSDLSSWISLYSIVTAAIWAYFICKKLP